MNECLPILDVQNSSSFCNMYTVCYSGKNLVRPFSSISNALAIRVENTLSITGHHSQQTGPDPC